MNKLLRTTYIWRWRARLPDRHGQAFRVLALGRANANAPAAFKIPLATVCMRRRVRPGLNSCLIEFLSDGCRFVTSRNALARARAGDHFPDLSKMVTTQRPNTHQPATSSPFHAEALTP